LKADWEHKRLVRVSAGWVAEPIKAVTLWMSARAWDSPGRRDIPGLISGPGDAIARAMTARPNAAPVPPTAKNSSNRASMFSGTTYRSEVVNNAFLLLLGYFFGQGGACAAAEQGRRDGREG